MIYAVIDTNVFVAATLEEYAEDAEMRPAGCVGIYSL